MLPDWVRGWMSTPRAPLLSTETNIRLMLFLACFGSLGVVYGMDLVWTHRGLWSVLAGAGVALLGMIPLVILGLHLHRPVRHGPKNPFLDGPSGL